MRVLTGLTAAAAALALAYAPARGFVPLLLVGMAHAAVLAPIDPVADALALGSARGIPGFDYGWVRGAGSAAFIVGALLAGQLVGGAGLGVIVTLNAGFLAAAALCGRAGAEPGCARGEPGRPRSPRRQHARRLARAGAHSRLRSADDDRGPGRRQPCHA